RCAIRSHETRRATVCSTTKNTKGTKARFVLFVSLVVHEKVRSPMVIFKVNGTDRSFDGDPDMPLLWYLRDDLRLTGTRFGCGAGLCGACTVHVEGQAVRSCQTAMRTLQNKRVVTIDGLSPNGNHPVQRAWVTLNVPQCGYCQSGQIMSAAALLTRTPN